ncbi:hypothetical protein SANTM175S_02493 [Streptomyces antimycoticus]
MPRQLGVVTEVAGDQLAVEAVDTGGHGGVGGEDGPGPHRLMGGVEAGAAGDQFADALQALESGVALVGVEHLGFGVAGEPAVRAQGADAADAQQHLLEQPVLAAAAVEPVGDLALAVAVLLHIGVEQQQWDPAHLGLPDAGVEGSAAGQGEAGSGRAGRPPRTAG